MTESHPEQAELLRFAIVDTSVETDTISRHLAGCARCRTVVDVLRTQANVLRLAPAPAMRATESCLDTDSIAAIADGTVDSTHIAVLLAHLLDCARCREEVASVARLLEAPDVKREGDRLSELPARRRRRRFIAVAAAAGLAAGLFFLLLPASSRVAKPQYREESLTGAAAPRLVSPVGDATALDAFQWTSVPRADRYRITVFTREGSVLWEAQTRDTAIALPDIVRSAPNDTILWRVDAHVGWEDRWAASDFAILTLHRASR